MFNNVRVFMLNNELDVQVSDTTMLNSSNKVWQKNILYAGKKR